MAFRALVLAFGATIALPASGQVSITDAWVRGTVGGQRTTGAFMKITAPTDSALVGAESPLAKIVEIHEMKLDGGVMRMRAVERLPLPAGKPVELSPGGYHVMLMGLREPAKVGAMVPITLTLEDRSGKRSTVEVQATVRPLASDMHGKH